MENGSEVGRVVRVGFFMRWEGVIWDREDGRIIERDGRGLRGWWNVESESVRVGFCVS